MTQTHEHEPEDTGHVRRAKTSGLGAWRTVWSQRCRVCGMVRVLSRTDGERWIDAGPWHPPAWRGTG